LARYLPDVPPSPFKWPLLLVRLLPTVLAVLGGGGCSRRVAAARWVPWPARGTLPLQCQGCGLGAGAGPRGPEPASVPLAVSSPGRPEWHLGPGQNPGRGGLGIGACHSAPGGRGSWHSARATAERGNARPGSALHWQVQWGPGHVRVKPNTTQRQAKSGFTNLKLNQAPVAAANHTQHHHEGGLRFRRRTHDSGRPGWSSPVPVNQPPAAGRPEGPVRPT
jgi:hypothetical protein